MPATWKKTGSNEYALKKRTKRVTPAGTDIEIVYEGSKAGLESIYPTIGSAVGLGYPSTITVRDYKHDTASEGPKGTLIIMASDRADGNTLESEKWCGYVAIEVDLRRHKIFNAGGAYVLTDAEKAQVDAWWNEPNAARRKAYKWTENEVEQGPLNAAQKELAKRWLRGQMSYAVYVPVARRTTFYLSSPIIGGCGKVDNPDPAIGAPTVNQNGKSIVYVKTADEKRQQGNGFWSRTEEWHGFDEGVDQDLINLT